MITRKFAISALMAGCLMMLPISIKPAATKFASIAGVSGKAAVGLFGVAAVYYGVIKPLHRAYTLSSFNNLRWMSGGNQKYALSTQAAAELKAFWAKVGQVTPELARGGIQDDGNGGFRKWFDNPLLTRQQKNLLKDEYDLAAMLAGFKQVCWPENLSRVFSSKAVLHEILAHYNITNITYLRAEGYADTLLYTPAGRTYALLLIQQDHIKSGHIQEGLLFGYSFDDILTFSLRDKSLFSPVTPLDKIQIRKQTSDCLEQSRKLIAERSPTVEQWIRDNARRLNITFS